MAGGSGGSGDRTPNEVRRGPQALNVDVGVKLIELIARASKPGPVPEPVTWGEAALRR
jgi:hypothetical protein